MEGVSGDFMEEMVLKEGWEQGGRGTEQRKGGKNRVYLGSLTGLG